MMTSSFRLPVRPPLPICREAPLAMVVPPDPELLKLPVNTTLPLCSWIAPATGKVPEISQVLPGALIFSKLTVLSFT
ncbi:hypothetical protein D3C80_2018880 [compost metagenome]